MNYYSTVYKNYVKLDVLLLLVFWQ